MRLSRRNFLALTGAAILQSARARGAEPGIRSISYNVLACRGYPRNSSTAEALDSAKTKMPELFAAELGQYEPDIITLQEGPPEDTVAEIADRLSMQYAWFPPGWPGNTDYPGGFPGAVITRYPIIESENTPTLAGGEPPAGYYTRHWGRTVLNSPRGPLHIFSAHLHASDADMRLKEVEAIAAVVASVDSKHHVVLQGDLNHRPTDREYPHWVQSGLVDAFAAKGSGSPETFSSVSPRSRIDYIWAGGALRESVTACRVLREGRFIPDPTDDASFALSDHLPVLADFG